MFSFLSRFSILKQIIMGYLPALAILCFLAFSNSKSFQRFNQNLAQRESITQENINFIHIERDLIELQRNVLVYSYIGYRGVLKKIDFLTQKLENKFAFMRPLIEDDPELKDRFDRMERHYKKYQKGFKQAIENKQAIHTLSTDNIEYRSGLMKKELEIIKTEFIGQGNFKEAYHLKEVEYDLLKATANIIAFRKSPDSLLINETRELIKDIKINLTALEEVLSKKPSYNEIKTLSDDLKIYQSDFKKIIRINRTYLHLINVVLAGQAAEMDKLSRELEILMHERAKNLTLGIQNDIEASQKQLTLLSVFAVLMGIFSAIVIAMGIAEPVTAMAKTLSKLSKGQADTEIPGQNRRDEVGDMAKSANEFKIMARDLEVQTAELEEFSYRTSHDLRSPLVSSIGLLELADKAIQKKNYDKLQKSISLTKTSLVKLEALVTDILELTKTKNVSEKESPIDFPDIIRDALQKFSYMEHFDRLNIQTDFNLPIEVMSKKSRIMLIIENLLSNAIKYQDTAKEHSYIKISTSHNKDYAIIEIEDNGIGIPKEQQSKMFTMFKRFHPKVSFGSGLGLYMMKKSVDIIRGKIIFTDTPQGSKFQLFVPYI